LANHAGLVAAIRRILYPLPSRHELTTRAASCRGRAGDRHVELLFGLDAKLSQDYKRKCQGGN
jgi:hypothetical protein